MIVIGTREHGAQRRRQVPVNADLYYKAEWMEAGADPLLSPTAFLIEQPANTTLVPHFHRQNQFQLFVGGGGTIGREPLRPVTVHYAGAFTGYGPLISGPQGIQYFTIRPVLDSGFIAVAGGRDKMPRGPKRHAQSAVIDVLDDKQLSELLAVRTEVAIAAAADGLGSFVTAIPARAAWAPEHLPGSQGYFLFVLAGQLHHGGQTLGHLEHLFVSSDEAPPLLEAGDGGVQVVTMHTPPIAAVYLEAQNAPAVGAAAS